MKVISENFIIESILLEVVFTYRKKQNENVDLPSFVEEEGPAILQVVEYFIGQDEAVEDKLLRCLKALSLAMYIQNVELDSLCQRITQRTITDLPFEIMELLMRSPVYGYRLGRGYDRDYDRGYPLDRSDRGYDDYGRGSDRGYYRGYPLDRGDRGYDDYGRGSDRGFKNQPVQGSFDSQPSQNTPPAEDQALM